MPAFSYKAVTREGEVKSGRLSAASREEVIAKIQAMGLIPLGAESAVAERLPEKAPARHFRRKTLNAKDIADFTRQLSILVGAGLPLDRALAIIRQVATMPVLSELVDTIQTEVRGGEPLSQALRAHPKYFSDFYINFIRAAEMSGNMSQCLEDLSRYLEKSRALQEKVISALIYPAILVLVTVLSLLIIVLYVLPEFAQLFEDMNAQLPASTAFVLGLADVVRDYGWLVAGLVALVVVYLLRKRRDDNWRLKWDTYRLSLPLAGDLIRKVEMARLSRSLGTLLKGGVPLLNAMGIARDSLQNRAMAAKLDEASGSLEEGSDLARPLMETQVFPDFALQMIQVGEETGQLETMLLRVADIYEDEVSTAMQRLLSVLEPVLIISLGAAIGGIIMSLLVAILSINELPI